MKYFFSVIARRALFPTKQSPRLSLDCFGRVRPRNDGPLLILLTFLLTACSALGGGTLGTATPPPPSATPFLSPTTVWFPPSETPTPRPLTTITTTPDERAGIGEVLATYMFRDETDWDIFESNEGTAALFDQSLTLSAAPGVYLISLNKSLVLGDFYAEATAHLNICVGADEYGILVRAIPVTYYRFSLSCDGHTRLDRVSGSTRNPLHESRLTADAPRGAPGQVVIGVWVAGDEIRIFLNGHFQFSVSDPNLKSGTIGFFVHATGKTPMTISFSDLLVYHLRVVQPVGTPVIVP